MRPRDRIEHAITRLAAVGGRVGWMARRLLGWPERFDVAELYRLLLGRTPASGEIDGKLGKHWRDTVAEILASQEWDRHQGRAFADRFLHGIAGFSADVEATRDDLELLFRQTQTYWHDVGSAPQTAYWSVLTTETLTTPPTVDQIRAFYDSGNQIGRTLTSIATMLRPAFSLSNCRVLEFGCGLGRVLQYFVGKTRHCEGWDFSQPHLELLETNLITLLRRDRAAFCTRLVESIDLPNGHEGFDLVYSVLVLQHNPPPLMAHFLRCLLRLLAPGGMALIHVPIAPAAPGYSFSMDDYRSGSARSMEMHAIPRAAVLRIASEEGTRLSWSAYTHWCGPDLLSELMAFTKSQGRPERKHLILPPEVSLANA